jgi:hypothetical protein
VNHHGPIYFKLGKAGEPVVHNVFPKIRRIAIPDKFYSISGSQAYLKEQAGITLKGIL